MTYSKKGKQVFPFKKKYMVRCFMYRFVTPLFYAAFIFGFSTNNTCNAA